MAPKLAKKIDQEKYGNELLAVLLRLSKKEKIFKYFVKGLLTPKEFEELGIRWQIVKMLKSHKTHRDIAKTLHTSIATITRGSRALQDDSEGFSKIIIKKK